MAPTFYRLESDGTPQGTRVIDPNGKEMSVRSVRYECAVGSVCVLHLEVYATAIITAPVDAVERTVVDVSELGQPCRKFASVPRRD